MSDMSLQDTPYRPAQKAYEPGMGDYFALMKPRVMSLVVFTALVGLLVSPVPVHPFIGFVAILCIAVGAGASGALNMWWDADIDAVMKRTARRPIPHAATCWPTPCCWCQLPLALVSRLSAGRSTWRLPSR